VVNMAQIVIVGKDWTARALLRAQLIEEGIVTEAYDNVGDTVQRLWASGAMPSLLIVDLFETENPVKDIATLSHWAKLLPIWIMAGRGIAEAERLEGRSFERVLFRPIDVGKLVQEIKKRLTGGRGKQPLRSKQASSRKRRLLLGQAMEGAEAPDEVHGVNADDRAIGKQFRQRAKRDAVFRIVEGRDQHCRVGDIKVGVAGRQALAVEAERRRHRERNHLYPRTVFQAHSFKPFAIFLEDRVIGVAGIVLAAQHHGFGVDEAAKVIHMAVRIVAGNALPEPQNVPHAEVLAQGRFDLFLVQARIPHLDSGIEQALFRSQKGSLTVHVDAAAFEHKVAFACSGLKQRKLESMGCALGNGVVLMPLRILDPGVKAEADDCNLGW